MNLAPDLRATLRSLRRSPGFLALTTLTLGLGVGAAAATFTLLDRVVLEPLPIRDEATVVVARSRHRTRALDHFPYTFRAWQLIVEGSRAASAVAATDASGARERLATDASGLTPFHWSRVLGDFFGVLGVTAVRGRTLLPSDDVAGGPPVAVVSHGLWLRRWGGDDTVLDATLTLGERTYTVVGVLPRDFDYPVGTEVWSPTRVDAGSEQDLASRLELDLVARLAPGASAEELGVQIRDLLTHDRELVSVYGDVEPLLAPFRDAVLGNSTSVAWLLFTGALLLVLVATSNVAHLVALRADERWLAFAVRRSLGASRFRLLLVPLAESAAITLLAALVAAPVVVFSLHVLPALAPSDLPRLDALVPTARTAGALGALLLPTAALLAALPVVATRGRHDRPFDALRRGRGADRRRRTTRGAIVAGQSALALWSVVAAALLVRSVAHLGALDPGFDPEGLELVQLDHRHRFFAVPAGWAEGARETMELLAAHPGIDSATAVVAPPLVGRGGLDIVPELPGRRADDPAKPYLNLELTLPGYFETMRLPLLRGRPTQAADRAGAAPALVVNAAAERALWPGESALGQRLRLPFPGFEQIEWTVVGVAADARYRELVVARPSLYVPLAQMPIVAPRWIVLRTTEQFASAPSVAAALAAFDPSVRVVGSSTLTDRLATPLARPRFALAVLAFVAGLVLLLAAVGTYGALAADVRNRLRELGVRIVCGASPRDVASLVLRAGLVRVAIGMLAGALAALLTGRFLASLLFGVDAHDPLALGAAVAVVTTTSVAACAWPVLVAARIDPATLLRDEG